MSNKTSNLRIPPQNLDAERAVIGAVLIDNSSIERVYDILKPEFFYDPKHIIIFENIIELYKGNSAIDVLTLTAKLKKNNKFKESGGAIYLSELISTVPTSANIIHYANLVKETFIRRSLIKFGAKLDEAAREEKQEIIDILDSLEQDLLSLSTDNAEEDFYDTETLLTLQMEKADEYAKNPDGLRGISSGIKTLDDILGGFHNSDFIILAARPSVGKSALAMNFGRMAAVKEGKSVAFFSLEMPALQVMERMLAQQTEIDLWNLRMGKLTDAEYKRVPEGHGKLGDAKIFINDTAGINVMQIRSKARKLKMEYGLDMIIIDYLQLMQTRDIDNRAQAVGEISRQLKILARELNIPIIALSQLNRSIETRGDRVPQLSDLRESGSIEQDADLVMFISREVNFDDEEDLQNKEFIKVDVHVAKHRNGPIGKCSLKFIGAQQRYEEFN